MKLNLKNISLISISSALAVASINRANAQSENYRPVISAVPSIGIAPDALGSSLGDQGASTLPDAYSQYWNPAKYVYSDSKAGFNLSYTPWLSKLVNDIALMQVGGYYQFGEEANQSVAASLRYFSLGKIQKFDFNGANLGEASSSEMAVDISYTRKLSEDFSMAVAMRYIRVQQDASSEVPAGNAFAADIAGYMHKYVDIFGGESLWTLGFNVKNIGTKISIDGGSTRNFLPTNLAIGTGLLYPIDDANMIGFNVEANKLLVPTINIAQGSTSEEQAEARQAYNNTSTIAGIFKSFADAPGGFAEEMKEIRYSAGIEYNYNYKFFLRAGYSYLDPSKGNLQFFTAGAGFKMSAISVDASYLISTVANNPLDQTLRFSLSFDMDGIKKLFE